MSIKSKPGDSLHDLRDLTELLIAANWIPILNLILNKNENEPSKQNYAFLEFDETSLLRHCGYSLYKECSK